MNKTSTSGSLVTRCHKYFSLLCFKLLLDWYVPVTTLVCLSLSSQLCANACVLFFRTPFLPLPFESWPGIRCLELENPFLNMLWANSWGQWARQDQQASHQKSGEQIVWYNMQHSTKERTFFQMVLLWSIFRRLQKWKDWPCWFMGFKWISGKTNNQEVGSTLLHSLAQDPAAGGGTTVGMIGWDSMSTVSICSGTIHLQHLQWFTVTAPAVEAGPSVWPPQDLRFRAGITLVLSNIPKPLKQLIYYYQCLRTE